MAWAARGRKLQECLGVETFWQGKALHADSLLKLLLECRPLNATSSRLSIALFSQTWFCEKEKVVCPDATSIFIAWSCCQLQERLCGEAVENERPCTSTPACTRKH